MVESIGEVKGTLDAAAAIENLKGGLLALSKTNPGIIKSFNDATINADGNYDIERITNLVTATLNVADGKGQSGKVDGVITTSEATQAIIDVYSKTGKDDTSPLKSALELKDRFPNVEVKTDDVAKMLKDALTRVDGIDGSKKDGAVSPKEMNAAVKQMEKGTFSLD